MLAGFRWQRWRFVRENVLVGAHEERRTQARAVAVDDRVESRECKDVAGLCCHEVSRQARSSRSFPTRLENVRGWYLHTCRPAFTLIEVRDAIDATVVALSCFVSYMNVALPSYI